MAYKLRLPAGCSIPPVFHVSMLKKKLGGEGISPVIDLPATQEAEMLITREKILATRKITSGQETVLQGLVKWLNLSVEDATWEDKDLILAQFPEFLHPWGQECADGKGIVTYRRRRYKRQNRVSGEGE